MKVVRLSSPIAIQHQTGNCCELWPHQLRHILQAAIAAETGSVPIRTGKSRMLFGKFDKSAQHRAATGQHNTGASLPFVSGIADFISHEMNDFFGARLEDVASRTVCAIARGWRDPMPATSKTSSLCAIDERAQPCSRLSRSASGIDVRKPTAMSLVKSSPPNGTTTVCRTAPW